MPSSSCSSRTWSPGRSSGPRDFLPQLQRTKRFDWARLQLGVQFFLLGLFKKAVLADRLAMRRRSGLRRPGPVRLRGRLAGRAGLRRADLLRLLRLHRHGHRPAHMLGFKLPDNFNMPYLAANITEFWRRWHISLSTWLRDYLYIPLGGNRRGTWATYRNLLLTMLLGGLWHGASWTFVVWGLYHGLLLALHRAWPWKDRLQILRPLSIAATFLRVCVGWVFFRAQTFTDAGTILSRMAWPVEGTMFGQTTLLMAWACLALIFLGHLLGTWVKSGPLWPRRPRPRDGRDPGRLPGPRPPPHARGWLGLHLLQFLRSPWLASSPQDKRGRRVMLWAVAFFFAIQLGAGVVIDHFWPAVRFPTAAIRFDIIESAPRTPDILFLGSSRSSAWASTPAPCTRGSRKPVPRPPWSPSTPAPRRATW